MLTIPFFDVISARVHHAEEELQALSTAGGRQTILLAVMDGVDPLMVLSVMLVLYWTDWLLSGTKCELIVSYN